MFLLKHLSPRVYEVDQLAQTIINQGWMPIYSNIVWDNQLTGTSRASRRYHS
jgi:hypothetical protein